MKNSMPSLLSRAFAALLWVAPQLSLAAVIPVTTTLDVVNPADGVTSLREAINQAAASNGADEVVLVGGATYNLTDCAAGELNHGSQDLLTLTGNGATVHQGCAGERVLRNNAAGPMMTDGSILVVDGVTFTGTPGVGSISGAGILAKGSVTISNSTFSGLDAGNGSILRGDPHTSFDLDQVNILNNQGSALTNAIGGATITGATITGNAGAGVNLTDGHPLVVSDSTISNNQGFGVRVTGSGEATANLTNVDIENNDGVGLVCSFCLSVSVVDSSISGNGISPAGEGGGGVHVIYGQNNVPAPTPPSTVISGSNLDNNTSTRPGGGLSIEAGDNQSAAMALTPTLTISNSSVNGNTAEAPGCCDGGGIFVATGDVEITSTTIDNNRAGVPGSVPGGGGGLYIEERDIGADVVPPTVTLTDVSVSDNEANNSGGGMTLRDIGDANLLRVQISGNTSHQASGGGLFSIAADTTMSESRVSDNTSRLNGGGVFVGMAFGSTNLGSMNIIGSTLNGNATTLGRGGAVIVDNLGGTSPLVIENSTVTGNSASESGGGITVGPAGDFTLRHTTLVANSAPAGANLEAFAPNLSVIDLEASILALPLGDVNCELHGGVPTSSAFNFADDNSCSLGATDVVQAVDPELGPLADNGGLTLTRLPAPSSPVAGIVPALSCPLASDQRGALRPQGPGCDAGSVEIAEAAGAAPIRGTEGPDVLIGTPGDDIILGYGGDDLILGLGGNDTIIGGDGRDIIFGGPGKDRLVGGNDRDFLFGGANRDVLLGENGNDILLGGPGFDRLNGGRGKDRCIPSGGTQTGC